MSVRRHSNGGTVVVTLGDGDTMISLARPDDGDDTYSCIVLYDGPARTKQWDERYDLRGDEVVVEFTNITGVLSLWRATLDMLATWPMDEDMRAAYRAEAEAIGALIERCREEARQQNGGADQRANTHAREGVPRLLSLLREREEENRRLRERVANLENGIRRLLEEMKPRV